MTSLVISVCCSISQNCILSLKIKIIFFGNDCLIHLWLVSAPQAVGVGHLATSLRLMIIQCHSEHRKFVHEDLKKYLLTAHILKIRKFGWQQIISYTILESLNEL